MTPRLRKFALTAHVTCSVGWLGSVASFLALAVAGLASRDAALVRATYLAMELMGWYVIVPLAFASLATGLVMSLGTPWGLFRHYWVLAKFLLTIGATALLLLHMQPTGTIADAARTAALSNTDLRGLRIQLVADAAAALLVLLVNTTLSIYKPRAMTPYGRRKELEQTMAAGDRAGMPTHLPTTSAPRWVKVSGIIALALVVLVVILHLMGRGLGAH